MNPGAGEEGVSPVPTPPPAAKEATRVPAAQAELWMEAACQDAKPAGSSTSIGSLTTPTMTSMAAAGSRKPGQDHAAQKCKVTTATLKMLNGIPESDTEAHRRREAAGQRAAARQLVKTATEEAAAAAAAAAEMVAAKEALKNVEEAAGEVAEPVTTSEAALAKGEQAAGKENGKQPEVAKVAEAEAVAMMAEAAAAGHPARELRTVVDKAAESQFQNSLTAGLKSDGGGLLERQVEGLISVTVELEEEGNGEGEEKKMKTISVLSRPWSAEEGEQFTKWMLEERRNARFFFSNVAKVMFADFFIISEWFKFKVEHEVEPFSA